MNHDFYKWLADNADQFSTNGVLNSNSIDLIISEAKASNINVPDHLLSASNKTTNSET